MKTDVEFAILHTPLFLGGTNLGDKLDPNKRTGLSLVFDEDRKRLIVGWNNKEANVPEANCASWVEGTVKPKSGVYQAPSGKTVTAQVSSPTDHVFAGHGSGKTGKSK